MGPSRYNHLIAFQPGRRVERAAAVLMKKETIGGNAPRENLLSRLHRQQNRTHIEPARISMLCISLPHPTHAKLRAVRSKKTFG